MSEQTVDEANLERIYKFLSEQQTGLLHLTNIMRADMRDVDAVLDRESSASSSASSSSQQSTQNLTTSSAASVYAQMKI